MLTQALRGLLARERQKSTTKGVLIFAVSSSLYLMTLVGIEVSTSFVQTILAVFLNGAFIGLLFIIGHDACHGSLVKSRWLNRLLGTMAFLPSYTPFSAWDLGHNRLHHRWTNLRGKDYVWCPYSPEEYRCLPTSQRLIERFYRSTIGFCFYGLVEIWWKHMMIPRASDLLKLNRKFFKWERCLLIVFAAGVVIALTGINPTLSYSIAFIEAVVVPFLIWHWMFGFLIFLHHAHPRVRWYEEEHEWSFEKVQLEGTVHILFPFPINLILHNIMEHPAHHIDPKVPLYNLVSAEKQLEEAYGSDVIVERWSVKYLRNILATCQLYDYKSHQWVPFEASNVSVKVDVNQENNISHTEIISQAFKDFRKISLVSDDPQRFNEPFAGLWLKLCGDSKLCPKSVGVEFRKFFKETLHNGFLQRHTLQKPYGYSGDFQLIDFIHTFHISNDEQDKKWDLIYQSQLAAVAVRNRKEIFKDLIAKVRSNGSQPVRILNLGSGPCRDVLEASITANPGDFLFHCVDSDPKAIEYGKRLLAANNVGDFAEFYHANILKFTASSDYDFVWCAGVFDYLSDRLATRMLRKMYRWSSPDGVCVVGNFAPHNPTRGYMELALDWHLVYRTEDDYLRLCNKARIPAGNVSFEWDKSGTILFCKMLKSSQ
jgi:acyl-lipid omega-6 desaturase (Delta-12 desaturase)